MLQISCDDDLFVLIIIFNVIIIIAASTIFQSKWTVILFVEQLVGHELTLFYPFTRHKYGDRVSGLPGEQPLLYTNTYIVKRCH